MPTRAERLLHCVRRIASQTGPAPNDSGLLARFLLGDDPAAFETLVARHGPMVLRVCQHVLGNRHDAEDAFQATFLVLARKAATVRPASCLASWLHGVAYRVALGARKAARRRPSLMPELAPPDPHPDPLAELATREALRILEEEVQRLPQVYRLPVMLCCLHGLTQDEVARQLGWTLGSVKGRLERGRRRLHRRLAARGLGLAPALALVEVGRATAAGLRAALVTRTALAGAAMALGDTTGAGLVSARVQWLAAAGLPHLALAKAKLGLLLLVTVAVAAGLVLGQPMPATVPPREKTAAQPSQAVPGQAPQNKEQKHTDRFGDALPPGTLARLGSARLNQGGSVVGLAFSPDSKLVASCGFAGGEDHAIHLWDVATGKEVGCFRGHEQPCYLSFSPDGKLLASADEGYDKPVKSVRLWDVATGKERFQCGEESRFVRNLAFSADGKLLAVLARQRDGYAVTLWDPATGKKVHTLNGKGPEMWSVAFTPDGATLATAGPEKGLHSWDVATGTQRRRIEAGKFYRLGRPLVFSPDGKVVALANDDHSIRLWDWASGAELPALRGHKKHIGQLAFADDGKTLISASEDRTIRFWDTTTAKELRTLAIAADNWDFRVMAISPNQKVLAIGGINNTIRLFDTATGKALHTRHGHTGPVEAVTFLPQGDLVASVGGNHVARWAETATGKERHRSVARPSYLMSMILSQQNDDRLLFCPVALSKDGSLLAVPGYAKENGEATVRIWEVASDREVGTLTGKIGSVIRLAFSADKKLLALACWNKTIRVWDLAAKREILRLSGHQDTIFAVAFSPNGKLLASGGADKTVRVWALATGKEVYRLPHDSGVHAVAFSQDSRSLATAGGDHLGTPAGDTRVHLWEVATGQLRGRLSGDHHLVTCLAFAPQGKLLALGSSDATVRVWDALAGKELRCFEGHRGLVNAVAFSHDGKRLVSGSTDTTVLVWDTAGLAGQR